jgi:hypothetical protein
LPGSIGWLWEDVAAHPLVILIFVVLAVEGVGTLALPLDLAHLGVTQALVPILRACRAERSLAIAPSLPLSTSPASV